MVQVQQVYNNYEVSTYTAPGPCFNHQEEGIHNGLIHRYGKLYKDTFAAHAVDELCNLSA